MPTLQQFIADSVSQLSFAPIRLDSPISLDDLPTPALVIDLELFERNMHTMRDHLQASKIDLRCHSKMHKSPIIAKKQLEMGAIGICCATVSEAEVMFASGIEAILVTSPIVTSDKIDRLITLATQSEQVEIVLDSIDGANALNSAAGQAGIKLSVLIDLDPGMGRTGIEPGPAALALAQHIVDHCTHLHFTGLQMYIGNCMHITGFDKRADKYRKLLQRGIDTRQLLEDAGIAVAVFSGGGTGTFNIDSDIGAIDDLQAGSYVFMDVEYRDIGGPGSELFVDFAPALFVLSTAISKPQQQLITFDAGIKSLATDNGYPELNGVEGVIYHFGGDEHGIVQLDNPSCEIKVGEKYAIITPHCDPTVNLYDYYYPHRNGVVEEIWPISARGRSQ